MLRHTFLRGLPGFALLAAAAPAAAQALSPGQFPGSTPITLVIPYPAGGIGDYLTRLVGKKLGSAMQAVLAEARAKKYLADAKAAGFDGKIRLLGLDEFEGCSALRELSDHSEVGLGVAQRSQAFSNQRQIVGQDDGVSFRLTNRDHRTPGRTVRIRVGLGSTP